jgi:hypothetical protein
MSSYIRAKKTYIARLRVKTMLVSQERNTESCTDHIICPYAQLREAVYPEGLLARHLTVHTGPIQRFKCPFCAKYRGNRAFSRNDHLIQHMRQFHRILDENRIKKSCIANTTTAGYMTRDPSRERAHFLTQLRNYRNTSGECITKFLFSALSLVATGQAQRDGSAAMIVPCISARCTLT